MNIKRFISFPFLLSCMAFLYSCNSNKSIDSESIAREFLYSVEKSDIDKCKQLYPNCITFIDSIRGHKYGSVTGVEIISEKEIKKDEEKGWAFWDNMRYDHISYCQKHESTSKIIVILKIGSDELVCGICPSCRVIVGSLGFVTFDKFECEVIKGPTDYDDKTRTSRVEFIHKADEIVRRYWDAVKAGDYNLASQLCIDEDIVFDNNSSLGALTKVDLSEIRLGTDPEYHCHTLYYGDKEVLVDFEKFIICNKRSRQGTTTYSQPTESYDDESEDRNRYTNSGSWKKDYRRDEFGNKDNSHPYIYQIWSGRRDDTFDCGLGILVCNDYIQLTITEEYIETNLAGATVTGQLNGNKFQINYDQAENESVYIANSAEAKKLLQALETDGTLMLAFRRTDSFDKTHIWLFTIYGSTNVIGAMQKFLNSN